MCENCFNGCSPSETSDKCIKYTGLDNPLLGICQGDPLSKVEAQILSFLNNLGNGSSITLDALTSCDFVTKNLPNTALTIPNVIQALATGQCTLKSLIDAISSSQITIKFNGNCLTLPTNPTPSDVINAMGTLLCSLNTSVSTISSDYVKASQLSSLITQYFSSTTSTTTIVQQAPKLIPYVAYEYYGPLSGFDATGKGLASAGFDKVYICNGANGTPDKRGRVAVGAIANVPGGTIDTAVDPTISGNPNYNLKDKSGVNFVGLDITQIPSHSHTVVDNGHTHNIKRGDSYSGSGEAQTGFVGGGQSGNRQPDAITSKEVTNITVDYAGGGQSHTNIQPSIAAYFIMYLPS